MSLCFVNLHAVKCTLLSGSLKLKFSGTGILVYCEPKDNLNALNTK